jgi:hypothetical protein
MAAQDFASARCNARPLLALLRIIFAQIGFQRRAVVGDGMVALVIFVIGEAAIELAWVKSGGSTSIIRVAEP